MKIKYYIQSCRLRTLPLSVAGTIVGSACAAHEGKVNLSITILAVLTTLSLQILSNLSNEVGDLEKGTDNDQRLGPIRSVQSGNLTIENLKSAMQLFIGLSVVFGVALVYVSFSTLFSINSLIMLLLGVGAITASVKYTFGKKSYGYIGLGDVFVFIFFGLVSVIGSSYLLLGYLNLIYILPAASIGLLSTGVLNVNNLRDVENDTNFNKKTIVVRMGVGISKLYHTLLVLLPFIFIAVFSFINHLSGLKYIIWLSFPLFVLHLIAIYRLSGRDLDSQLKVLSLSTLFFSILLSIILIWG